MGSPHQRQPRALGDSHARRLQAGLSWHTVLTKREAFREAFHRFDPHKVAAMTAHDVDRLMGNPGIIRARAKIEATIGGARLFVQMQTAGEDFGQWVWSLHGSPTRNAGLVPAQTAKSTEISKALKQRGFKFVGPTIVYAWMQAVGMVDDHAEDCFLHLGKALGADSVPHTASPIGANSASSPPPTR